MKINGYEVALSEADLDDKLNNQTAVSYTHLTLPTT